MASSPRSPPRAPSPVIKDGSRKNLECPICLSLLKDPHLTDCCGHNFCRLCILRVKESSQSCPVCREETFSIFPNLERKREVGLVSVYCSHRSNGCEWIGQLSHFDEHVKGCKYASYPCPHNCGAMLYSNQLEEHEMHCPNKPIDVQDTIRQLKRDYNCLVGAIDGIKLTLQELSEQNKSLKIELNGLRDTQNKSFRKVFEAQEEIQLQLEDKRGRNDLANQKYIELQSQFDKISDSLRSVHTLQQSIPQYDNTLDHLSNCTAANKSAISKLESHLSHMTITTSSTPPVVLIMTDFNHNRIAGRWWQSKPFYSHPCGYKFCLEVKAAGTGSGAGTHVSVYVHLMRGSFDDKLKWPLAADVHFRLVDHLNSLHLDNKVTFAPDNEASLRVTSSDVITGTGRGFSQFILLEALQGEFSSKYLKNDCLTFEIMKIVRYND